MGGRKGCTSAAATLVLASVVVAALASVAHATHPRPGGGTPFRVPLVPAFGQCTSPNATHAAPLALPSCSPPHDGSPLLRMGSDTGNAQGSAKLTVFCTDGQAVPCVGDGIATDTQDIRIDAMVSAVTCMTPGCGPSFPWGNSYEPDPAGDRIAFSSDRDGDFDIYTMDADGTDVSQVTNDPAVDTEPTWSSTGTRLAFQSDRGANVDVYAINTDGFLPARLTSEPGFDGEPSWSQSTFLGVSKIAFTSDRDGDYDVYSMTPEGSGVTNISQAPGSDRAPDWWTSHAERITFQSDRDGDDEIFTTNFDGTNPWNHTDNPAADREPAWNPVAGVFGFTTNRDGNVEIYTMFDLGFQQTNISNNAASDRSPAFSPDGTRVAFVSDRSGNDEIYVMPRTGGPAVNVSNNPADDVAPAWGPVPTGPPDVLFSSALRLTDHANPSLCTSSLGNPPCVTGTSTDVNFSMPADCVPRPLGSVCSVSTTVDALLPGTVKEFQRTVASLPGLTVLDRGPDNDVDPGGPIPCPPVCGTGDESAFATQGLFLP